MWLWRKIGQHSVIVYTVFEVLAYPVPHTKVQIFRSISSGEEVFCYIYIDLFNEAVLFNLRGVRSPPSRLNKTVDLKITVLKNGPPSLASDSLHAVGNSKSLQLLLCTKL